MFYIALLLLGMVAGQASAQEPDRRASQAAGSISGRVLFPDGTPVAGARVSVATAARASEAEVTTGPGGAFSVAGLPPGLHEVQVTQEGVTAARRVVQVNPGGEARVEIIAVLAGRRESITVTATLDPRPAAAVPSSVTVIDGDTIRHSPAPTLDEALRTVPGFSLFRRTSSLSAHPTAQGVSLRGVGPSGASRSLVLADGFPINDPFGGWVYWNRVPREAVGSVELLRGAASSLYGNAALSGVVQVLSERPQRNTLRASLSGGSTGLVDGSWVAATRSGSGRWGVSLDGEALRNDGYFAVAPSDRGAADTPFALDYVSTRARVERTLAGEGLLFASFGLLSEDRRNGTGLQTNSTDLRYASFGAEVRAAGGVLRAGIFAQGESFRSTFSSISRDRNRETLTLSQRVPSNAAAARAEWSRSLVRHHVTLGGDAQWVDGSSREQSPQAFRAVGGRQWLGGAFIQDVFTPATAWQLVASARLDGWQSTEHASGKTASATVVNPQLGVRYQAAPRLALRAQAYRGFRAPTLNELYRQFQVGSIVTRANPGLRPERTNGAEAGMDVQAGGGLLRLTGFWSELRDPVSNVTLPGAGNLRQRQNVGRARIRGIEADWDWQVRPGVEFRAGYLFDDATVQRFAPDPGLQGRRLPQVPRHQGSLALEVRTWRRGRLRVQQRFSGVQFDDDRNLLPLAGFGEAGAAFFMPLGSHVEAFLLAENLFDRRYPVARTPIETLSAPRLVQVGLRFRSNAR